MKIHTVKQRSEAWYRLRLGIPTASEASKIITPKGKPSAQADAYLDRLLAEWSFGAPLEDYQSEWMQRGEALEVNARKAYEFIKDCRVEQVGFVTVDSGMIGCSPDGLVGDDGVLELKCPSPAVHMRYLRTGSIEAEYYPQLQMELLVTERKWADIVSYCPPWPETIVRVERDDEYQGTLTNLLVAFVGRIIEARNDLITRFPTLKERLAA